HNRRLYGLPRPTKSYFEPEKIAASTSPSDAGPSEIATRSELFSAPSNSIPVLLRMAVTTLLRFELSACTLSSPSRYVTTGGTAGARGESAVRDTVCCGWLADGAVGVAAGICG